MLMGRFADNPHSESLGEHDYVALQSRQKMQILCFQTKQG